jgi:hypothetical protein
MGDDIGIGMGERYSVALCGDAGRSQAVRWLLASFGDFQKRGKEGGFAEGAEGLGMGHEA